MTPPVPPAIVAVTAAVLAGSVALFGFGIDSFVESASGLVMIWRLRVERSGRMNEGQLDAIEHRIDDQRFAAAPAGNEVGIGT